MIVFVQRVFSDYRRPFFQACGEAFGGVMVFHHRNRHLTKVKEPQTEGITSVRFRNWLPAVLEKRGVFANPWLPFAVARQDSDLVVIEGESNLPINLLLVPLLMLRGRKYAWFTLGRPTTRGTTWRRRLCWPLIKWMIQRAEKVACYSSAGKDYLEKMGIDGAKIVVLNNAIDPKVVLAKEQDNQTQAPALVEKFGWQDRLRVVYLGAMAADKKPLLLLEVAARYRERTGKPLGLLFVGDGDQREPCEQRASELGIDAQFVGRQAADEAGQYILAGHVVVLPGLGGLAINHAMMLGRPVICGRADGTEQDLVLDGETGFYLDPLDENTLLDALLHLAENRELAAALGAQAKSHVNAVASIPQMVERLLGAERLQHKGDSSKAAA